MNTTLDMRRIIVFLAFAFGIAWAVALVVYLLGGLTAPAALPLFAIGYMGAPALAVVLTRLLTREGWADAGLRPNFKRGWPYWAMAWVLPALLVLLGIALFFLVFPQYLDTEYTYLRELLPVQIDPLLFIGIQIVQAILIAPLVNGLATFGEEFGWRAYLLPRLMALGWRKAMLVSGVIWGVWHWPAIAMGHNYGLSYPGYPWTGMLMMVLLTFALGVFLSWVTLRGGSVWPAVIGHAALNGIGALPVLFTHGEPNRLLGPYIGGFVAMIPFLLVALYLFFRAPAAQRSFFFARPPRESAEEAASL